MRKQNSPPWHIPDETTCIIPEAIPWHIELNTCCKPSLVFSTSMSLAIKIQINYFTHSTLKIFHMLQFQMNSNLLLSQRSRKASCWVSSHAAISTNCSLSCQKVVKTISNFCYACTMETTSGWLMFLSWYLVDSFLLSGSYSSHFEWIKTVDFVEIFLVTM